MSEQEQIDDYRRVEAFLADPAVKRAFTKVKESVYRRFEDARDPEQALDAWMLTRALSQISTELIITMNDGKIAFQKQEQREQAERARAARAPRK